MSGNLSPEEQREFDRLRSKKDGTKPAMALSERTCSTLAFGCAEDMIILKCFHLDRHAGAAKKNPATGGSFIPVSWRRFSDPHRHAGQNGAEAGLLLLVHCKVHKMLCVRVSACACAGLRTCVCVRVGWVRDMGCGWGLGMDV